MAQAPSLFGASSGSAFGASPAPAFGAGTMPTFGAASAPGAFGAASAPAFGAAAAPAPAFGASAPAFGATSAPAFGAGFGATSAPAFGAAASTPGFGAAASTPSLFGATSTAAFGGGGLFGAAASSAPSPSFSFNQPASQAALTTTAFGAATGLPGTNTLFGQAGGALTTQAAAPMGQSMDPLMTVLRDLEKIKQYYTTSDPACKFKHIFSNRVEDPAQRVRPPDVDVITWQQALDSIGADNPDRLWPVVGRGFADLLTRGQVQQVELQATTQRLQDLRDLTHRLERRQQVDFKQRIEAVRGRHLELTRRLLALARHVDALESRLGAGQGASAFVQRTSALSKALERVEQDLYPGSAGGLQRRLDAVAATTRLRAAGGGVLGLDSAAGGGSGAGEGGGGGGQLDAESEAQLFSVLKEHVDAIKRLQEVVRRDLLDLDVIKGPAAPGAAPAGLNVTMMETL